MVNSRLSQFPAARSPSSVRRKATRAPLLPKVRGQFAEFLDRGSLVHLGGVPPAYRCRCAVRAHCALASGFSRRPGPGPLPCSCEHSCQLSCAARGICLPGALQPGSPSCPFDGLACPTASPLPSYTRHSGAGLSHLLSIAYDYDVLGLGPDSPWGD